MKGEALYGLVKAVKRSNYYGNSGDWELIDRGKRFSMKELSILVQLPHIPKEHVSYFCGRLEATIRDAEQAGMQNRKQIATDLLEGMRKLAAIYAGTYQPEVEAVEQVETQEVVA